MQSSKDIDIKLKSDFRLDDAVDIELKSDTARQAYGNDLTLDVAQRGAISKMPNHENSKLIETTIPRIL